MKAATPHGELPSEGSWQVILRLPHGNKEKNQSGSRKDSNLTRSRSAIAVNKSSQLNCVSASSTTESWDEYQDMQKKIESTARISRTGYGRGLRENPSMKELVGLRPQAMDIGWMVFLDYEEKFQCSNGQVQEVVRN